MGDIKDKNVDYRIDEGDSSGGIHLLFWQKAIYALLVFIVIANFAIIIIYHNRIDDLKKQNTSIQEIVKQLTGKNDKLKKTVDEKNAVIKRLSRPNARCQKTIEQFEKIRGKITSKIDSIAKIIARMLDPKLIYRSGELIGYYSYVEEQNAYDSRRNSYIYNLRVNLLVRNEHYSYEKVDFEVEIDFNNLKPQNIRLISKPVVLAPLDFEMVKEMIARINPILSDKPLLSQSESIIDVKITDPIRDGFGVGKTMDVKGTATIPSGNYLWVLVHRVEGFKNVWWPQNEAEINPITKKWEVHIVFGGLQDIGFDFEIAAIVVDKKEHLKLQEYRNRAMMSGDWRPIPLPSIVTTPTYRRVRKSNHD